MRIFNLSILTCGLSLFILACHNSNRSGASMATAWIAALNRHDTNAIAGMYNDNAMIESPNWEGAKIGPGEIRTIYRRYFSSTPDLAQRITHLVTTDTCLVIEYDSWGVLQNPEKLTPDYMRGKKYLLHNCTVISLKNGKVIRQKIYFDQVSFLRQMGYFDQR